MINKYVRGETTMKTYLLYKVEYRRASKVSGEPAYKLWFVEPSTMEEYICWVDTSNRNWERCGWEHILNQPEPRGLYTGMKRRKKTYRGQPCLNADSKPVLVKDWDTVNDEVFGRNTFGELFEWA